MWSDIQILSRTLVANESSVAVNAHLMYCRCLTIYFIQCLSLQAIFIRQMSRQSAKNSIDVMLEYNFSFFINVNKVFLEKFWNSKKILKFFGSKYSEWLEFFLHTFQKILKDFFCFNLNFFDHLWVGVQLFWSKLKTNFCPQTSFFVILNIF